MDLIYEDNNITFYDVSELIPPPPQIKHENSDSELRNSNSELSLLPNT